MKASPSIPASPQVRGGGLCRAWRPSELLTKRCLGLTNIFPALTQKSPE